MYLGASVWDVKQNLDDVKMSVHDVRMAAKTLEKTRSTKGLVIRGRKPGIRAASAKAAGKAKTKPSEGTYHHGDLPTALLEAAERILEREGLQGLTLRAAAREAGVSHAAPTHHFGDLTGLLSELAAVGYRKFNAAISKARTEAETPDASFDATGEAYVMFALKHPGLFQLMFRAERLDMQRPALQEAVMASFRNFAGAVGTMRHENINTAALSLPQAADMVRTWSMVHGFAILAQHGRFNHILQRLPEGTSVQMLMRAMLKSKTLIPTSGSSS